MRMVADDLELKLSDLDPKADPKTYNAVINKAMTFMPLLLDAYEQGGIPIVDAAQSVRGAGAATTVVDPQALFDQADGAINEAVRIKNEGDPRSIDEILDEVQSQGRR
jgi:hypothetical protein